MLLNLLDRSVTLCKHMVVIYNCLVIVRRNMILFSKKIYAIVNLHLFNVIFMFLYGKFIFEIVW